MAKLCRVGQKIPKQQGKTVCYDHCNKEVLNVEKGKIHPALRIDKEVLKQIQNIASVPGGDDCFSGSW